MIPGNGNATIDDWWFPSIRDALGERGFTVIAKNMPDPDLARQEFWLPFIEKELQVDKNSIVIGHSSGAVAIMRYLEKHQLLGVVLVGASYTDLGDEHEKQSGYYDKPWQWEKIKNNTKWILQFASTDDSYIPILEHRFVHEKLNTEYQEFSDRGHFMVKEFPELLDAVLKKTKKHLGHKTQL